MTSPSTSSTETDKSTEKKPRDAVYWAQVGHTVHMGGAPAGALNQNLDGRQLTGPMRGFGPLWQKTYRFALTGVKASPAEVISMWKENFPSFWPKGNHFYGPITGIAPGDVALINADMPGGLKLSTGVMVLYADDESFTFMTPEGHLFAGWVTFSAYEKAGQTVVQVQVLMRSHDPLMEIGLRLGGHKQEDRFWQETLTNLAQHLGVQGRPETILVRVDPRMQWSQVRNIRYNPFIRSTMYTLAAPVRWVRRREAR